MKALVLVAVAALALGSFAQTAQANDKAPAHKEGKMKKGAKKPAKEESAPAQPAGEAHDAGHEAAPAGH